MVTQARIEALVIARAATARDGLTLGDLVKPLARFARPEVTVAAWRAQLEAAVAELRAHGVLDDAHRVQDREELVRRIGRTTARTWPQLADRVLPGLGLGIDGDDSKAHGRLAGRDAWAAAIAGRALGLWREGAPPSLAALCDALAWRELGLAGAPKRCPPEVRAVFVQRQLGSEAGPPERLVRLLAAREVGAPRPELRALREALVRRWLAGPVGTGGAGAGVDDNGGGGRGAVDGGGGQGAVDGGQRAVDGGQRAADGGQRAVDGGQRAVDGDGGQGAVDGDGGQGAVDGDGGQGAVDGDGGQGAVDGDGGRGGDGDGGGGASAFAGDVAEAARAVREGRFGDRKIFVSAVWGELRAQPRWAELALDDFKARLLAAHRAGEVTLARADLVAAMDPELVAASEIAADGASFHFVVQEPVT